VEPAARLGDLVLPEEWRRTALGLASSADHTVLYLQGPYGVGKETVAEALCREAGLGLLVIDLERLLAADDETFETALDLAAREAVLQNAALLWQGFDGLLEDDRRGRRARFLGRVADAVRDSAGSGAPALAFLTGNADWEPSDALHEAGFVRLAVPLPDARERAELWRQALAGSGLEEDVDLAALAGKFRFTAGQIRDAAATARSIFRVSRVSRAARARDPHGPAGNLPLDDLLAASRLQSNPRLAALAQKITPRYGWDDIVLPRDRKDQLREICNTVKYRARVYEEWGFGGKLAMGKGVNILFAGPSGTGKTMAAEIIAGELGLDLYRIDLSTVVSKYIGETEKNLSKVFAEAETSNAVLFFDEADALFGKRSEVRDAHDRYANLEISYLLQRMEAYEGVVILATNLRKNMDDAFVRRLHFAIEFPFPNDGDRLRIWSGLWPEGVPRSPEVDLEFLARRFEVPGGNIRNIAVAATFLAAADGGVVTMAHLIRALQREYQKMGKVTLPGEFGEYAGFAAR
ncbi:MAG TPA: AAA family ATPase, partial [Thermoanaerobaculia bacterium]|nr:AAA family ATPase [Thermoanaerobaculia bacterium]